VRHLRNSALDGVLHRSGKFAVGAAKLFQKHITETRIRFVNPHGVHKFFDVVIHEVFLDVRGNLAVEPSLPVCPSSQVKTFADP
jgi:hypothetical protein